MMAVPITTGVTLSPGAPDGRFLVNTELDAGGATVPITLIQNWTSDAKKK